MTQGRETHDPTWVPQITGIGKPFVTIMEFARQTIEKGVAFEGTREALEACAALAEVQDRGAGEYTSGYEIDPEAAVNAIKEGRQLVEDNRIVPEKDAFTGLLLEMLQALDVNKETRDKLAANIKNLHQWDEYFIGGLESQPESLEDDFIGDVEIDPNIFFAAFLAAWQVFAATQAAAYRPHVERQTWDPSTCPVCGSLPDMARIEATEGHLYLVCPLCLTEWKHTRIKCPWCGNEDQKTLGFFTAEEYPGYRVNICHKCNGYIKATYEKALNRRHIPTIDNLLTLELDLQAEHEGFKRPEE
jgi:FdhE protein